MKGMDIPDIATIRSDWRNAIQIDEGFSPQERAKIEQSLKDIAHFHDDEGAKLLQTAMANNNGEKILIRPGVRESQAGVIVRDGVEYGAVALNFDQLRTMAVQTEQGLKPYDLTTLMTHELFHLADNPRDVDAQAFTTAMKQLNIPTNSPEALAFGNTLQDISRATGSSIPMIVTEMMAKPDIGADALSKAGQPMTAARLVLSSPEANIDALKRDGVLSSEQATQHIIRFPSAAIPRAEQDAVQFTHAIMQKNYGESVTAPTSYMQDIVTTQPQAQIYVVPRTGNEFATAGFTAQAYAVDLGELTPPPAPSVAPNPDRTTQR